MRPSRVKKSSANVQTRTRIRWLTLILNTPPPISFLLSRHRTVGGGPNTHVRLAGFLPLCISTAHPSPRANGEPSPTPSHVYSPSPLHLYILHHDRSIPCSSTHVHILAMCIPPLSLALLALALSGSANGKLEAADPPTAAHRPTYLAPENTPTAVRQDTLALSPTMDLIRRQSVSSIPTPISSLPSPVPPVPLISESPLPLFSLCSPRTACL